MVVRTGCLDERYIEIYEHDMVNNTDILIFKIYGIRRDLGVWEFPAPQIFNEQVYSNNKVKYEQIIQGFRNDCQGVIADEVSLLVNQVDSLKKENEKLMVAIAEIAESR